MLSLAYASLGLFRHHLSRLESAHLYHSPPCPTSPSQDHFGISKPSGTSSWGFMITSHRRRRGPREVIVQNAPELLVDRDADIFHRLIETSDRPLIHFLMQPVAAVDPNHRGLITILIGIDRWSAECLCPVRGKPLGMLRVITVAKSVADDFIF